MSETRERLEELYQGCATKDCEYLRRTTHNLPYCGYGEAAGHPRRMDIKDCPGYANYSASGGKEVPFNKELRAKILNMYDAGTDRETIATECGISIGTVRQITRKDIRAKAEAAAVVVAEEPISDEKPTRKSTSAATDGSSILDLIAWVVDYAARCNVSPQRINAHDREATASGRGNDMSVTITVRKDNQDA